MICACAGAGPNELIGVELLSTDIYNIFRIFPIAIEQNSSTWSLITRDRFVMTGDFKTCRIIAPFSPRCCFWCPCGPAASYEDAGMPLSTVVCWYARDCVRKWVVISRELITLLISSLQSRKYNVFAI